MEKGTKIFAGLFAALLMFNAGYFVNEFVVDHPGNQSEDLNLSNASNIQEVLIENKTDVEIQNQTNEDIIMAEKKVVKQVPKTERKFKEPPKEDPNFKLGYKVNCKGRIGQIVGVDRGDGPSSEKIFVEFDGKPENVLKSDCEVIERTEHQW